MSKHVRVTIVGLGRVGLGLALALKMAAGEQVFVVGHDKDPQRTQLAAHKKAIDKGDWNLPRSVEGADLIILALPFSQIRETLSFIANDVRENAVITDTASLMTPVLRWAQELLPDTAHFIPGHPILRDVLGNDTEVPPETFRGMVYCVGTTSQAHPQAVRLISDVIALLGARPLFIQPEEHDALVAGVEQMPQVMALVLLHALTRSPAWQDMRKLAGAQLEASTYLSVNDAEALATMLLANRKHVLTWLDGVEKHVRYWQELLSSGDEERLAEYVALLREEREAWLQAALSGSWEEGRKSEPGFSVWDWLFGESFARRRRTRKG